MAISYVDTTELNSLAKEYLGYVDEFNTEITELFNRLSNVPNTTGEWVGVQANYYFSKMTADKKKYTDFADKLRSVGNKISNDSSQIQTIISKNKTNES